MCETERKNNIQLFFCILVIFRHFWPKMPRESKNKYKLLDPNHQPVYTWQYSIQWLISSDIRVVVCNLIQPATLKHIFHSYVRVRLSEVYSNIWFFRENAQIIWFIWGNVQKVVELGKNNETKLNSGYIGLKHCEQCWGFWKFGWIKIPKRAIYINICQTNFGRIVMDKAYPLI